MRDYLKWHDAYDDPNSDLSWRLRQAQTYISQALDHLPGPVTVLSLCAGDGRDVLHVLADRDDTSRVHTTLIELHQDAGNTAAYVGSVPADLVIMMGIFGNIRNDDVHRTIETAPQLCRPGATLLWSRGKNGNDRNASVRAWLSKAGFTELDYLESDQDESERAALGSARYDGPPQPLVPGRQLFTFLQ
jgi:hypothetical protein